MFSEVFFILWDAEPKKNYNGLASTWSRMQRTKSTVCMNAQIVFCVDASMPL